MKATHPFWAARAARRNTRHWRQEQVTWEDLVEWAKSPAGEKECGSYLLGKLRPTTCDCASCKGQKEQLLRKKTTIIERDAITLDSDSPQPGFLDGVEILLPWANIVHSTYSSTPETPRYRVIVPVDRPLTPDEYHAAAERLMDMLGRENFDPGSSQPERYMFMPATQDADTYVYRINDGAPAPADALLVAFTVDLSDRETPRVHPNKRDPYEIEGVVGMFNRVYRFPEVIEGWELPYEPDGPDRWRLVGARSAAGMGIVSDGIVFSHHVNDPSYNRACSAFDLVRLHRFGQLDENTNPQTPINRLPSTKAMIDLAMTDPRVTAEAVGADFDTEMDAVAQDDAWKMGLTLSTRTAKMLDSIHNWDLVLAHDPVLSSLQLNTLTVSIETTADSLPWRPVEESHGGTRIGSGDRAALAFYVEREYGLRPPRSLMDDLIAAIAQTRQVNPLVAYLSGLKWDGKPRVETALPGVAVSAYTRMVARKSLVAAVARVFDPGVKWDHTLVLYGSEGLGKSWWIDRMSKGYSSTLGRITDKDTLLTMMRSWIVTSDEGYSLRKADAEGLKEFLTRREDVFRIPYEREATVHPRRCVIWGTTNDEVFLRKQEGNRRFLIVRCEQAMEFDAVTPAYVDQVWAEAVRYYRDGEALFLNDEQSELAALNRQEHIEEDATQGMIAEYLETRVPEEWDDMSPEARRTWLQNRADNLVPPGTEIIRQVCSAQLWVEALGQRYGDHSRADLLAIASALHDIPGWDSLPGRHRLPHYGPQLVFERKGEDHSDLL